MRPNHVALGALSALLLTGCGIDVRGAIEDETSPAGTEAAREFAAGRTTADEVLGRFGPPGEVGRAGDGYYYLYRTRDFGEWGVVLRPFLVSKVGVFSADGEGRTLLLAFDAEDRLVSVHDGGEILPEGWGGLAGHFATGLDFFSIETRPPVPSPAPWGSPLLELAPIPGDL